MLEEEEDERVELVEVDLEAAKCIELPEKYADEGVMPADMSGCAETIEANVSDTEELKTNITEEEAKQIALERVPGEVTDIAVEMKKDKLCYVVEVDAGSGSETDVIIDIETGEVLGIET